MTRRVATALLLAALASGLAAQPARPPAPWLDPDRSEPAGSRYATFPSQLAGGEVSYLIYLPPGYEAAPERRYPVVYWLHGLGGDQRRGAAFVTRLNLAIRNGRAPAMIAVLVNGLRDSFYCDSRDGRWPVESVIVKELIPHIDRAYRTLARREARAIEGYSMGGYGAAHLAFKFPEVFGLAGIMAGAALDFETVASKHSDLLKKVFGDDRDYFAANHPATLLEQNAAQIRGRMRIRIAVGDRDNLEPRSQALHEQLRRLKIDHEYEVVPGVAHNMPLFYEQLGPRAFNFYAEALTPLTTGRSRPPDTIVPGRSLVLKRGDLEILTFETEPDYDRLEQLLAATDQAAPQPATLTTLYLRSHMDGSVQPYAIWLPRHYTPSTRYPLLVQLHGLNFKKVLGGGQRIKFRGWGGSRDRSPWLDENLPVLVAQCFGRQSTFYQGMGEEDVLEVIADVQRRFPVDPDRVYLMGHSMGGAGSYTVGLHYPDRFGGLLPMDPAMGRFLTLPTGLPEWVRPQVALYTPEKLFPNARNVDVFFKNAGAGIQGDSIRFTDGILAEGGFSTTEPFPGLDHSFGHLYSYAMFLPQATLHPISRSPAEVKFYTTTLRYNQAYWVTVDRLARHNADAAVTARVEPAVAGGAARVSVTTTNLQALTLRLAGAALPKETPATVTIDGQSALSGTLPAVAHFARTAGRWERVQAPATGGKRHGLQGPIGDALNSRFVAVYGEGDRELAIAELDGLRNPPGALTIAGDFPMKPASLVTAEDIRAANLILFGTPATNPVLKRIASALPVELMRAQDGQPIFIHPNPENPQRYVVVWSGRLLSNPDNGLRVGLIMPINLLPDYVLVRDGKPVRGGYFDGDWKLLPSPQ